jgi:branched-subunit amino acid ABC-type transport system permease component
MSFSNDIVTLLSAMTEASSLFIAAAGLTLVFGAMRIINIAHGSFYMYGAFLLSAVAGATGGARFWLALLIAPLIVAAIGTTVEVTVLRRVYAMEHLVQLVVTYALFLIFADLALKFWGTTPRSVSVPSVLSGSLTIGRGRFPAYDLFAIGMAIAVGLAMWALLQRSALGWRIRAAVEDPETLATSGTNVPLLSTTVHRRGDRRPWICRGGRHRGCGHQPVRHGRRAVGAEVAIGVHLSGDDRRPRAAPMGAAWDAGALACVPARAEQPSNWVR